MKFIQKRKKERRATKKIVVLYHQNCADGFGSAWAAWRKFGRDADYIGVNHQAPVPKGLKDKLIYTVDFTYPWPITKKLIKDNIQVTSVDHHISSKETTLKTFEPLYALHHSGAVLSWMYFHPKKKIPALLRHVEDMDIWKFRLPKTKEVLAYLDLFDFDFKVWSGLAKNFENPSKKREYIKSGSFILRHEDKLVTRLIANNKEKVRFAGFTTYAVNSAFFSSQIGHRLATILPPIGIIWHRKAGVTYVSLRSDGSVDVSKLAARYGGGGHKAAAAFSVKGDKKLPWKTLKK